MADLSCLGDEYVAALGGAGGKGNRFFLANDNRAPVTCTPGEPGQERELFLELKTVAHAGMVGVTKSPRWEEVALSCGKPVSGGGTCHRPKERSGSPFSGWHPVASNGSCALTCVVRDPETHPDLGLSHTEEMAAHPLSCRSDSPMQASPRFSGPFPMRSPLWPPTHSQP